MSTHHVPAAHDADVRHSYLERRAAYSFPLWVSR
jgi:hypothetical protein